MTPPDAARAAPRALYHSRYTAPRAPVRRHRFQVYVMIDDPAGDTARARLTAALHQLGPSTDFHIAHANEVRPGTPANPDYDYEAIFGETPCPPTTSR